jgi:hypothetical protein
MWFCDLNLRKQKIGGRLMIKRPRGLFFYDFVYFSDAAENSLPTIPPPARDAEDAGQQQHD